MTTFRGRIVAAIAVPLALVPSLLPPDAGATPSPPTASAGAGQPASTDLALPPPRFSDVGADHPFAEEIGWAADNGVTGGYPDGTFRGGAPVTRQAFAAFLARYWVSPDVPTTCSTAPFPDVAVDSPFCPQITWLKTRGLATGYPDGTFRPGATITRQALAAVLYRFRGSPDGPDPTCDAKPASDVPVGHGFCGEIAWLTDVGLTTATPTTPFNPGATTTRQAAVTFLHRLDPGCHPKTELTGGCPRPAVPGDYDGDRTADPVWVAESHGAATIEWFDGPDPTPLRTDPKAGVSHVADGDYDGDGRWEPTAIRPDGSWATAGGAGGIDAAPPCDPIPVEVPGGGLLALPTPIAGDWDGDRTTDPGWYCPGDATWHLEGTAPFVFGAPLDLDAPLPSYDVPAPADYDADGTIDPAVYRPRDGSWWVHGQVGPAATGLGIGVPVPADVDGDGADDPVLFHVDDAVFEIPGLGSVPAPVDPGAPCGPVPAPADHDGDGTAELAVTIGDAYVIAGDPPTVIPLPRRCPPPWPTVVDPEDYIRMVFLERSCRLGDQLSYDARLCPRVAVPGDMDGDRIADLAWREETGIAWGIAGDPIRHPGPDPACQPDAHPEGACIQNISVPGDWDGDGDWDHGVYVHATGTWVSGGVSTSLPKPDCATTDPSHPSFEYPLPVPGQWDDDWATDPAWYCTTEGTWHFEDGSTLALGVPGPHSPEWLPDGQGSEGFWYDIPVPGFDADGDGIDDPAVYRPTDGTLRTAAGVEASGLGLGLPLVGRFQGSNRLVTVFQPSADSQMDPPPQPEPHRWRFSAGGPQPVDVPLDPARPYLLPALLDVDGDGTDELAGIARDDLGGGTTEHYLVDGQAPVEFYDEWAYLPMTMPAPTIYRFIPVVFMLQTCRTTDACPAELWP